MYSPLKILLPAACLLLALPVFSQASNDDCSTATVLTPSAGTTCATLLAGTTQGATYSGATACNTPAPDVWYSFTATSTVHGVEFSNVYDAQYNYYYGYVAAELWSGSCGSLQSILCSPQYGAQGTFRFGGLTPGETYYLRVFSVYGQPINFELCLHTPLPPPAHDECTGAVTLAVAPAGECVMATAGTTAGATTSVLPACVSCYPVDDDVWYRFTATQQNHDLHWTDVVNAENTTSSSVLYFTAYTGSCTTLAELSNGAYYGAGTHPLTGLTPGETYYVRVFGGVGNRINYNLCITAPLPPANDECAGAIEVPVYPGIGCDSAFFSGTQYATSSGFGTCTGMTANDVWLFFTATAAQHRVEFYPYYGTDTLGFEAYRGSCGSLTSVGCCSAYNNAADLSGLTVGETVYLRVFTAVGVAPLALTVCVQTLPGPPANDECASAAILPVSTGLTCDSSSYGTTLGATASAPVPDCGSAAPVRDVWYSFVATSNQHRLQIVPVANHYGFYTGMGVEVRAGGCANPTIVYCRPADGGYAPVTLTDLTPGETYFVRVFTPQAVAVSFSICIQTLPPPPPNSTCATAQSLVPSPGPACSNPVTGNTSGVTEETPSTCYYFHGSALWYSFTATSTAHLLEVSNVQTLYGSYGYLIELYEGTDCDSLTYLGCRPYANFEYLSNLTPGRVYYVRWVGSSQSAHSFSLCLGTVIPPVNDGCAGAVDVPVNPDLLCSQTVAGSTAGGTADSVACQVVPADVWYRFVPTQGVHRIRIDNVSAYGQPGAPQNVSLELFAGPCDTLASVYCWSDYAYGSLAVTAGDLVAGQPYYLRVGGLNQLPIDFIVCITTPPAPPANDACAGAVDLTPPPGGGCIPVAGTTYAATASPGVSPLCCDLGDVWYTFTATQHNYTVQFSDIEAQYSYYGALIAELYAEGCAGTPVLNNLYASGFASWQVTNLTPEVTYWIRVRPNYYGSVNFNICVTPTPVPPNDECAGALELPTNTDYQCGATVLASTLGATSSRPDCAGQTVNDVWYSFTATTPSYRFDLDPVTGTYANWGYEVLGGDCTNPVSLRCMSVYSSTAFVIGDLTVGHTYYVRIYSISQVVHEINICLRALPPPPANDHCAQAAPTPIAPNLNCDTPVAGTTLGADLDFAGCVGEATHDVFYSFTATQATHQVNLEFSTTYFNGNSYNIGFEVLHGDCNNGLTSVYCQSYLYQNSFVVSDLTAGETYYVRVFSKFYTAHDFTLCIATLPPPPANASCPAAEPVAPNVGSVCDVVYPGTTVNATPSGFGYTGVWYTFTATSNSHIIGLENIQTVYGNPYGQAVEIYGGDCNNLQHLGTLYGGTPLLLTFFEPGETYYLLVHNYNNQSGFNFDLCIRTLPSSPANEHCADAITVPANNGNNCDLVFAGTTAGAVTYDYIACGYGPDVWYKFIALAPTHVIEVSNRADVPGYPTSYADLWMEVLQSSDCQGFTSLACSGGGPVYLFNLVPGQTYYLKMASTQGAAHTFDLCIRTLFPPANDVCANAAEVLPEPTNDCFQPVTGTTVGASVSGTSSTCAYDAYDVWYRFTATQAAHTIAVTNVIGESYGSYYAMQFSVEVFAGNCGSLTPVLCRGNLYSSDNFIVGDLQAGVEYFIRIQTQQPTATFDLCITTPPPPPANDACAGALNLPVSPDMTCAAPVFGTTTNATPSNQFPNYGYPANDVWFVFTAAQANQIVQIDNIGPYSDYLQVEVFTGTCAGLVSRGSAYVLSNYNGNLLLTNLTPGTGYYLRVSGYYTQNQNFDICVLSPPVPANDECAGAIALQLNEALECIVSTSGSTFGATESGASCSTSVSPVSDVWYTFTATSASHRLEVNHLGSSYPSGTFGIEVLEGSCPAPGQYLTCQPFTYGLVTTITGLVPGHTYYVRLYAYRDQVNDFTICLTTLPPPPANDECTGATVIAPNSGVECEVVYAGTTLGASQSQQSCYGAPTHDVWYQFTATSTAHVLQVLTTEGVFPISYGSLGVQVYSGANCDQLAAQGSCYEYPGGAPMLLENLTPGATYYVRVFSTNDQAHNFTLCLRTLPPPPPNAQCAQAVTVTPSTDLNCSSPLPVSTAGWKTSSFYAGCASGAAAWYRFTATSTIHQIELQSLVPHFGSSYLSVELFQGGCSDLQLLQCAGNDQPLYAAGLEVGTTYYLRVVSDPYSAVAFDLCVLTVPPAPNDACEQAIALGVSPETECTTAVTGTLLGAGLDPADNVYCYGIADVWYSFVATQSTHVVTLSNASPLEALYYTFVELRSGTCGSMAVLACSNASYPATFDNLTPGETYYLRVGTQGTRATSFDICVTTPQPDLSPTYWYSYAGQCAPGADETIVVAVQNFGGAAVPAGAATFTLTVTGPNAAVYGPITNPAPMYPYYGTWIQFNGVDLSAIGANDFVVTVAAPREDNLTNNTLSFQLNTLPLQTYYQDLDGDGFGNSAISYEGCFQYGGYVPVGGDCDDYNAAVHPEAPEYCNGFDDDCNGLLDGADPDVIDTESPTITCPTDLTASTAPGSCAATVGFEVVGSDDCTFTVTQTTGLASGQPFPIGVTTNTYTVSDSGGNTATCSFTVTVQKSADPELLYAYTAIGLNEVTLKANTVQSGGIGVVNAGKKAKLQQGTLVTAANTFVKAPVIELQGGSQATTQYSGQTASSLVPAFLPNTNPGSNNVTLNSNPSGLYLASYGKVTVGQNVVATFYGQPVVDIRELELKPGASIVFTQGTVLRIDKTLVLGQNAKINPGGAHAVQIYVEDNVTVGKGAQIRANVYTLKNLNADGATAAAPTMLTGLFIADKIDAKDFVIWNWDAAYCPYNAVELRENAAADAVADEPVTGTLKLFPNPASEACTVEFTLENALETTIQVYDGTGRLMHTETAAGLPGANRVALRLDGWPEGLYTVQVVGQQVVGVGRLVVVR